MTATARDVEIAKAWTERLPFLTVLSAPESSGPERVDGLALARDARAFNFGLETVGWRDFTHIGKLDGDVELPPEWFETLLGCFRTDLQLGITGGRLAEQGSRGWRRI